MRALADAIIRDARPADHADAAAILTAAAFTTGVVTGWAEPDPAARGPQLGGYFTALLAHAAEHGLIRYATTARGPAAVAVWYRYPLRTPDANPHAVTPDLPGPAPQAAVRLDRLEQALAARHPTRRPHLFLAYLGVHPDQQNQRIGSTLLADQHQQHPGAGFYLEANDPRNRALYLRHDYTDHGEPVTVGGSPPVWPMWRHPSRPASRT